MRAFSRATGLLLNKGVERTGRIAADSRQDSLERLNRDVSDAETRTQDKAQQKTFSKRLYALRKRVADNHANLTSGNPTKLYSVPAGFLDARAPCAEEYSLLAEIHDCQSQLSAQLKITNDPVPRRKIIEEVKKWDVDDIESYIKQLAPYCQYISKGSGDQSASVPQRRNTQMSTVMQPETPEESSLIANSDSSMVHGPFPSDSNAERRASIEHEDPNKKTVSRKNRSAIDGLRKCLRKNNERLASGGFERTKPFTGRPYDTRLGNSQLETSTRLEHAIDMQLQLSRRMAESNDPAVVAEVLAFAQSWTSKEWNATICSQYEESLSGSYSRLANVGTKASSLEATLSAKDETRLTVTSIRKTPKDTSRFGTLQAAQQTRDSPLLQNKSHPPSIADSQRSRRSSNEVDVSWSGQSTSGGNMSSTLAPATGQNVAARAPLRPLATNTVQSTATASDGSKTPASTETDHSGENSSAKTLIVRLSLPNDSTTAPRRLIWSPDLNRDTFFSKVQERFSDSSVHSVEVSTSDDRFLIEPKGSDDEWRILQEELYELLSQPSSKKPQIHAVVHVR